LIKKQLTVVCLFLLNNTLDYVDNMQRKSGANCLINVKIII